MQGWQKVKDSGVALHLPFPKSGVARVPRPHLFRHPWFWYSYLDLFLDSFGKVVKEAKNFYWKSAVWFNMTTSVLGLQVHSYLNYFDLINIKKQQTWCWISEIEHC